jgi:hypothetical protein
LPGSKYARNTLLINALCIERTFGTPIAMQQPVANGTADKPGHTLAEFTLPALF